MPESPILAASLILIREAEDRPLELLMVERSAAMTAFGGAMVFPGGRVDAADKALAGTASDPLAKFKIAAIRETLEETAIAVGISPLPSPAEAAELQAKLHAGSDFGALLAQSGLSVDLESLTHFAHWRPDHLIGRRFETHFFVARAANPNWEPRVDGTECEAASWQSCTTVLQRMRAGEAKLVFPTICNLQRIGQHADFAAVLNDATNHPVEVIVPTIEHRDGEPWIVIGDSHGYPVTSGRARAVEKDLPHRLEH